MPKVFYYGLTDSTNTRAREFAETGEISGDIPAIFFSRAQSAGRGTRGRTFESPEDGGLYFSALIGAKAASRAGTRLTAMAAVATCRAIEALCEGRLCPKIKWVNDLTVNDRKLCGILTEGALDEGGRVRYAVVGIGVNLTSAEHSDAVKQIMTTLQDEGENISAHELCAALTVELYRTLFEDAEALMREYARRQSLIGRKINVIANGEIYAAVATALDSDGALLVRRESGECERLISGDVSVRPERRS